MRTMIKYFLVGIIGVAFGYFWAFQAYQPLKIKKENQELRLSLKLMHKAYVRDISKKFLDDSHEIVR